MPTSHWQDVSDLPHWLEREAGECELYVCPGSRVNWFVEHISVFISTLKNRDCISVVFLYLLYFTHHRKLIKVWWASLIVNVEGCSLTCRWFKLITLHYGCLRMIYHSLSDEVAIFEYRNPVRLFTVESPAQGLDMAICLLNAWVLRGKKTELVYVKLGNTNWGD